MPATAQAPEVIAPTSPAEQPEASSSQRPKRESRPRSEKNHRIRSIYLRGRGLSDEEVAKQLQRDEQHRLRRQEARYAVDRFVDTQQHERHWFSPRTLLVGMTEAVVKWNVARRVTRAMEKNGINIVTEDFVREAAKNAIRRWRNEGEKAKLQAAVKEAKGLTEVRLRMQGIAKGARTPDEMMERISEDQVGGIADFTESLYREIVVPYLQDHVTPSQDGGKPGKPGKLPPPTPEEITKAQESIAALATSDPRFADLNTKEMARAFLLLAREIGTAGITADQADQGKQLLEGKLFSTGPVAEMDRIYWERLAWMGVQWGKNIALGALGIAMANPATVGTALVATFGIYMIMNYRKLRLERIVRNIDVARGTLQPTPEGQGWLARAWGVDWNREQANGLLGTKGDMFWAMVTRSGVGTATGAAMFFLGESPIGHAIGSGLGKLKEAAGETAPGHTVGDALGGLGDTIGNGLGEVGNAKDALLRLAGLEHQTQAGCFIAGTMILMADGSSKRIEEVTVGEMVFSYDEKTQEIVTKEVLEVVSPVHETMLTIHFANGVENTNTLDHPYLTVEKGWVSYDPEATEKKYGLTVAKLAKQDQVYSYVEDKLEEVIVEELTVIHGKTQTYNLSNIADTHTFFANGILVHNKVQSIINGDHPKPENAPTPDTAQATTELPYHELKPDANGNYEIHGIGANADKLVHIPGGSLPHDATLAEVNGHPGIYDIVSRANPLRVYAYDIHIDSASVAGHITLDGHWAVPVDQLHPGTAFQELHTRGYEYLGNAIQQHGNQYTFDFQHAQVNDVHGAINAAATNVKTAEVNWFNNGNTPLDQMPHMAVDPEHLPFAMALDKNTDYLVQNMGGNTYGLLVQVAADGKTGAIMYAFNLDNHAAGLFNSPLETFQHDPTSVHMNYYDLRQYHLTVGDVTNPNAGPDITNAINHHISEGLAKVGTTNAFGANGEYAHNVGGPTFDHNFYNVPHGTNAQLTPWGQYNAYQHIVDFTNFPQAPIPLDWWHGLWGSVENGFHSIGHPLIWVNAAAFAVGFVGERKTYGKKIIYEATGAGGTAVTLGAGAALAHAFVPGFAAGFGASWALRKFKGRGGKPPAQSTPPGQKPKRKLRLFGKRQSSPRQLPPLQVGPRAGKQAQSGKIGEALTRHGKQNSEFDRYLNTDGILDRVAGEQGITNVQQGQGAQALQSVLEQEGLLENEAQKIQTEIQRIAGSITRWENGTPYHEVNGQEEPYSQDEIVADIAAIIEPIRRNAIIDRAVPNSNEANRLAAAAGIHVANQSRAKTEVITELQKMLNSTPAADLSAILLHTQGTQQQDGLRALVGFRSLPDGLAIDDIAAQLGVTGNTRQDRIIAVGQYYGGQAPLSGDAINHSVEAYRGQHQQIGNTPGDRRQAAEEIEESLREAHIEASFGQHSPSAQTRPLIRATLGAAGTSNKELAEAAAAAGLRAEDVEAALNTQNPSRELNIRIAQAALREVQFGSPQGLEQLANLVGPNLFDMNSPENTMHNIAAALTSPKSVQNPGGRGLEGLTVRDVIDRAVNVAANNGSHVEAVDINAELNIPAAAAVLRRLLGNQQIQEIDALASAFGAPGNNPQEKLDNIARVLVMDLGFDATKLNSYLATLMTKTQSHQPVDANEILSALELPAMQGVMGKIPQNMQQAIFGAFKANNVNEAAQNALDQGLDALVILRGLKAARSQARGNRQLTADMLLNQIKGERAQGIVRTHINDTIAVQVAQMLGLPNFTPQSSADDARRAIAAELNESDLQQLWLDLGSTTINNRNAMNTASIIRPHQMESAVVQKLSNYQGITPAQVADAVVPHASGKTPALTDLGLYLARFGLTPQEFKDAVEAAAQGGTNVLAADIAANLETRLFTAAFRTKNPGTSILNELRRAYNLSGASTDQLVTAMRSRGITAAAFIQALEQHGNDPQAFITALQSSQQGNPIAQSTP